MNYVHENYYTRKKESERITDKRIILIQLTTHRRDGDWRVQRVLSVPLHKIII